MIKIIIIVVIIITVGLGVFFLKGNLPKSGYSGPTESVSLALNLKSAQELSTLIFLAEELGYFEKNGIQLNLKSYDSGGAAVSAFQKGEADMAISGDFAMVSRMATDNKIRIIASLAEAHVSQVVARKDKGISVPSDLRGKKIALTKGTQSEYDLGVYLTRNGISLSEIAIVNSTPDEVFAALQQGTVDAVVIWEPFVKNLVDTLGSNQIHWSADNGTPLYWLLASTDMYVRDHKDTVTRVIRSLHQAEMYWKQYPSESKELMIKRTGITAEYAEYIFPKVNIKLALPQALLIVFENETQWMIQQKLNNVAKVPNYLDFIYLDALKTIKPESVSIIK